ncbi:MAG: ImmA/IrrE family metallo-endopeptidase [Planctomycetaceae bacterium]
MMKQDDTVLPVESQKEVAKYADLLLRKAGAVGRFPTPVADLVKAAKLEVARESALERIGLDNFYRRLPNALKLAPDVLKRAAEKVIGLLHRDDRMIHLDPTLHPKRKTYITIHEIGHDFLPHQRSTFKILEDSDSELDADTHDLFEREANVFASEVLFQGGLFTKEAADCEIGIRVPVDLSKRYGPSVYASARRYVSTHRQPCALIVFEPAVDLIGVGNVITLRRIVYSKAFKQRFGELNLADTWGEGSFFYQHRPRNKFTAPVHCNVNDVNGDRQLCVVDAFDTTHNILFLMRLAA